MLAAPNAFAIAGGATTVMLAVAVGLVPPSVELTTTLLLLSPAVVPVTFTATVSNSEPVTHAGWGPWEDNPSLNENLGIAWVSGGGGTRNLGNDAVFITNLTGGDHGSSGRALPTRPLQHDGDGTADSLALRDVDAAR